MLEKIQDKQTLDLLKLARETSWQKALESRLKKQKPLRYERITYEAAADWLYLLPLNKEAVILDAGSGWGTLTFQLAQHYKTVVALDNSPYAVEFVHIRARQDDVRNIFPLLADVLELPFPENYFDLIIINGLLEWVGLSDTSKDPLAVQKRFLKEVSRVLKPDGCIYVGIENRYSATYFLGEREGHTDLKYISLMPRSLGKIYHRLFKKSEFRAYTHFLKKYHTMLKEAGFVNISTYAPIPHYQKYSHIISLEHSDYLKYYTRNLVVLRKVSALFFAKIVKYLHLHGLAKYFVPCYSFLGGNQLRDQLIGSFLKTQWRSLFPEQKRVPDKFFHVLYSGGDHITLFIFPDKSKVPICIAKIQRFLPGKELEKEYTLLQKLNVTKHKSPLIKNSIPQPLYYGKIGDNRVLLEEAMEGICMERIIKKKTHPLWWLGLKENLHLVKNWLVEFQHLTRKGSITLEGKALKNHLSPIYDAIGKDRKILQNEKYVLSRLKKLERQVMGKSIPLVMQHRDLSPSNIFIGKHGIQVVDWELARESGEPLYDMFYFLSFYFYFVFYKLPKEPIADFKAVSKFKKRIYFNGRGYIHRIVARLLQDYCQDIGMDSNVVKLLFLWQEIDKYNNTEMLNLFFEKEDAFAISN